MFKAAWKSLLGRKLRLLMSTFAIVIGVAFVSGSLIFTDTLSRSFEAIFASSVGSFIKRALPRPAWGSAIATFTVELSAPTQDWVSVGMHTQGNGIGFRRSTANWPAASQPAQREQGKSVLQPHAAEQPHDSGHVHRHLGDLGDLPGLQHQAGLVGLQRPSGRQLDLHRAAGADDPVEEASGVHAEGRVAEVVGAGEFELFVHRSRTRGVGVELAEKPILLFPAWLLEQSEAAR